MDRQPNKPRSLSATTIFAGVVGLALAFTGYSVVNHQQTVNVVDPTNYALRTERLLSTTPLIDGHNDLPYLLRIELQNRIYGDDKFKFRDGTFLPAPQGCADQANIAHQASLATLTLSA